MEHSDNLMQVQTIMEQAEFKLEERLSYQNYCMEIDAADEATMREMFKLFLCHHMSQMKQMRTLLLAELDRSVKIEFSNQGGSFLNSSR